MKLFAHVPDFHYCRLWILICLVVTYSLVIGVVSFGFSGFRLAVLGLSAFKRHWHWVCECDIGNKLLALCDFALGRLISATNDSLLGSYRVSFFPYTVFRVTERCGRCAIDQYCARDADHVDAQSMRLHAFYDVCSVCPSHQLVVCCTIHRSLSCVLFTGGRLTNTNSSVSRTNVSRPRLSKRYFSLLRGSQSLDNDF